MEKSSFPPSIAGVFLFSMAYWLYLASTTSMVIVWDAAHYESLGRMIYTQGWVPYFTTGPNNEPIYPLLIAASMHMGHITGLAYVRIMAVFGVIIMFLTQALTYKILRLFNIRNGICILVLAYLAMSPALNNSAFSLFSEIAAYPFILGIPLASYYAWEAIQQNNQKKSLGLGLLLGALLAMATLVKAVFEFIAPAYLIVFFATVFFQPAACPRSAETNAPGTLQKIKTLLLCLAAAASFYYIPISGYKWLNLHYNGNFVMTDRGSWAIYGNTARRMEPLTPKRFAEALAFAPGEGVCNSIFGPKECDFWSFRESDRFGLGKRNELSHQYLSPEKINTTLISLSAQKVIHNPFQYALLTGIEGLKMFFWESTKIAFVTYPGWLQKIYDIKIFNNGLRFFVGLLTLIAMGALWIGSFAPSRSLLGFLVGSLIFFYILFYSFFFILTRYALPIAPLYLISIGIWLNRIFPLVLKRSLR